MKAMKVIRTWVIAVMSLVCIWNLALAQDVKTYIHPRAAAIMSVIKLEAERFAPGIVTPWYFAGLIEHESCISLKHSTCWSSTSQLKNNREQGVGLGMITRAWDSNGKLRFDNLEGMKRQYPNQLSELSWGTIKSRPDLQIRTMVMMVQDSYRKLEPVKDPLERLKMTDSAYNGGLSHVTKSRSLCGLSKGCDPQIWYGHVEKYLPKSKTPDARYGGRSMYQINTGHIRDVFEVRMNKFEPYFRETDVEEFFIRFY